MKPLPRYQSLNGATTKELIAELSKRSGVWQGLVSMSLDGPRYDSTHPMNAPMGATNWLELWGDEAVSVGTKVLIAVLEKSQFDLPPAGGVS